MILAIVGLVLLGYGGYCLIKARTGKTAWQNAMSDTQSSLTNWAIVLVGAFLIFSRSFVIVDAGEVGHLKRVFAAGDMAPGQVIAVGLQKGPKAEVLPPGFHFIPFVRVLNEVEYFPVVEVSEGQLGFLIARDGVPLRDNQFLADPWAEADYTQMLNAKHFLTEGIGQKGPQFTVLRPGVYRLNMYLWEVKMQDALDVPTGHVAVVRSNVQTEDRDCPDVMTTASGGTNQQVSMPVVSKGCVGVWDEPLPPGRYYLNQAAFVPTIIPTRLQTWEYKGGYTERKINLTVTDEGKITQQETETPVEVPKGAADRAIMVRVEGWTVPVEMRVVVQVHPKDAPIVVASVGDLTRIENSIITPSIRDILRTIGGDKERKVLDFLEKRDEITSLVERAVAGEGLKAGVTIQEVRMGEPAIPPELLVARLREQLAGQLEETYLKEREAQALRIETEKARALADQQPELVKAEIAKQAAEFQREQLRLQGEGEKLKLNEIAEGQRSIANVLGQERTLQLQMLEKLLAAAVENPDIIKVPNVSVTGGTSLEGGAAVLGQLLGGSNAAQFTQSQRPSN